MMTTNIYDLKMSSKFCIPLNIDSFMIKRKSENNGGRAVDCIEVIAQELDNE